MAMNKTGISWAAYTWNFLRGCTKVSAGCKNCYAEELALRYGWSLNSWTVQHAAENFNYYPSKLDDPRKVKSGARIFVNSMSDTFHELTPKWLLLQAFDVMRECQQHTFMILTKRPERAIEWGPYPDNVWLGTSIENEAAAYRLDYLKRAEAKTKFVSFEPLLGPLDGVNLTGIQWAIIGGESGPKFRPMDMLWARALRDKALEAGAAVFFKQDSSARPGTRPYIVEVDGSKTHWQQFPDEAPAPIPAPPTEVKGDYKQLTCSKG